MKKQLLQEAEIRKMMKFANLGALSNDFVEKINETYHGDDDMVPESMMSEEEDDDTLPMDAAPDAASETGLEEPDVGPLPDEVATSPAEPEAEVDPEVVKTAVMTIIDGLKEKLQELYGEAAPDLEATEEPDGEPVDAAADSLAPDEASDVGAGMTSPEAPMSVSPEEEEGLEEDFINEMTRKVASRLVRAARK